MFVMREDGSVHVVSTQCMLFRLLPVARRAGLIEERAAPLGLRMNDTGH